MYEFRIDKLFMPSCYEWTEVEKDYKLFNKIIEKINFKNPDSYEECYEGDNERCGFKIRIDDRFLPEEKEYLFEKLYRGLAYSDGSYDLCGSNITLYYNDKCKIELLRYNQSFDAILCVPFDKVEKYSCAA